LETLEYNTFAEKCTEEVLLLQEQLKKNHDLNFYENWYYNQATGLITFSTDDKEINFKYFEVGTFSNNTNTWMWSWDNDHTLGKVKAHATFITDFGRTSNFSKLTNGHFASDESESWEFAAIANKILNGIGVYRSVDEHLYIFLVLMEFVDNDEAQKIKDKYVDCEVHDSNRIAFVCQHINKKERVGFLEAFETSENMELEEDDEFQAWCDKCEKVCVEEGEWNEKSMAFADIKLVCEACYFEMKELNLGYKLSK
jgi:hypothetical protein